MSSLWVGALVLLVPLCAGRGRTWATSNVALPLPGQRVRPLLDPRRTQRRGRARRRASSTVWCEIPDVDRVHGHDLRPGAAREADHRRTAATCRPALNAFILKPRLVHRHRRSVPGWRLQRREEARGSRRTSSQAATNRCRSRSSPRSCSCSRCSPRWACSHRHRRRRARLRRKKRRRRRTPSSRT